jgi:hypothetical protein
MYGLRPGADFIDMARAILRHELARLVRVATANLSAAVDGPIFD